MTPATSMLVGCVLQVTLFSVLAGAAYLVARRVAAGAAGALLAGSLALVLGLTLLAGSPWPRWEWRATPPAEVAAVAATPTAKSPTIASEQTAAKPTPELASPYAAAWEAFTAALTTPPRVSPTIENRPLLSWTNGFWLLAGVGLLVSAGRLAWGVWQVQKLVRRSRPVTNAAATTIFADLVDRLSLGESVTLRVCPGLATPATVGWRRPQVLLPAAWTEWSADELRAALAHELAHVAARDYRAWLVARLAVAVHFYHPLVRWLAGRLQLEQELAADAAAARLVGDRQNYLACLASLALSTPPQRLAGPARTLFPSRSLLMRRVEMLRCNVSPRLGLVSGWLRGVSVGLMALVALGVAGVRQPSAIADEKPAAYDVISFADETPERIPLSVVPADAVYAVSVRPAELLADEAYDPLLDELDAAGDLGVIRREAGVSLREMSEVLAILNDDVEHSSGRIVIRLVTAESSESLFEWLKQDERLVSQEDSPETWTNEQKRLLRLDPRTLIMDIVKDGSQPPPVRLAKAPEWAAEWERQSDQQVVSVFNVTELRRIIGPERGELIGGYPMQAMAPAFDHTDWLVTSVGLGEALALNAVAQCDDEEYAGRIAKMLQGLLLMGSGIAEQQSSAVLRELDDLPPEEQDKYRPLAEQMLAIPGDFLENAEPVAEGKRVTLSYATDAISAGQAATITTMLLPSIKAAQNAARRTQSMNNMRQLAVAMHAYHADHGSFPPAVLYKEGSPHPYSWRVALLPYFDHERVYELYNFDEPWDSEANKAVAAFGRPLFQSPFDDPSSINTSYFVPTGPGTVFDGKEGTKMDDITDGLGNTLLIVEAKRAVPWTKPEDLPYAADKPLPEFGGWMTGSGEGEWSLFLAAWCDGRVTFSPQEVDEATRRGWITRAGGEPNTTDGVTANGKSNTAEIRTVELLSP